MPCWMVPPYVLGGHQPGQTPKQLLRPQTSSAVKSGTFLLSYKDDIPKSLFLGSQHPPGSQHQCEHRFPSFCSNLSHS